MAEPTSTALAAATYGSAALALPVLTAFGVPLGLRPDLLIAGFAGSLVAIVLLNSVPSTGDTWRELSHTTLRRMFVALASSLTAGYLTPILALISSVPNELMIGSAFAVGGGAQKALMNVISRVTGGSSNDRS